MRSNDATASRRRGALKPMISWLAALCLIVGCGPAIPPPTTTSPPLNVFAVATSGGSELVAIGGTNQLALARSDDRGQTWHVGSPIGPAMTTVAVLDDRRLLGATDCVTRQSANGPVGPTPSSCLYSSDDGGDTWIDIGAGRLVDPSFIDASHGWARAPLDLPLAPPPHEMYATLDGGRTWTMIDSPCSAPTPWVGQVVETALDAGFALCVGPSDDLGRRPWTFVEVQPGENPMVRSASGTSAVPRDHFVLGFMMREDGHGLLWAGELLFTTGDRGATWNQTTSGTPDQANFGRGVLLSDDVGYVTNTSVGNYTAVLATRDGGRTWTQLISWPYDWGARSW